LAGYEHCPLTDNGIRAQRRIPAIRAVVLTERIVANNFNPLGARVNDATLAQ
jgi:hypothetical protein